MQSGPGDEGSEGIVENSTTPCVGIANPYAS
ncbi:UNVERIFIED_CONTAM: hypothetical protein ABIE34_001728 [Jeotgalibacillus campisalis]